ncbi:putative cyclin-dependent serine/threonine-protein kinase DDB_G0272797/DDB_G0274007 [Belonocnema kinseyi]|uniref:putative cyclin-dependent serine/threonine-protein kinase DDB_G0272797/DDB_G0274007 n=1 Tax=Belonocnema kinseyi TaxID=2817044 RepID=UPI00143DA1B1|nr:putative cyclin-dependent serine/threonine-protein kinase DDB_G0272797/DDB_G0274007 [Belonocnema kinseyi]
MLSDVITSGSRPERESSVRAYQARFNNIVKQSKTLIELLLLFYDSSPARKASTSRRSRTPDKKLEIIPLNEIEHLEYAEGGEEIVVHGKLIAKLDYGEIIPFIHELVHFASMDDITHANIKHITSGVWLGLITIWLNDQNYRHPRLMRSALDAVRRIEDREKALKSGQPIMEPARSAISSHIEDAPNSHPHQETSDGYTPHRRGFQYVYREDSNIGNTPRLNEAQRLELEQKQRKRMIVRQVRQQEQQLEQLRQQLYQMKLYRQQQHQAGMLKPSSEEKLMLQKILRDQKVLEEEHEQLQSQYVSLQQEEQQLQQQQYEEQLQRQLHNPQQDHQGQHFQPSQFDPPHPNNPYNSYYPYNQH